jgi:hypothetical protein
MLHKITYKEENMSKKLVASIDGGLVNKMMAYLSCKVISRYMNRDLYIYWHPHLGGLCESLLILFKDNECFSIDKEQYKAYIDEGDGDNIYDKEEFVSIEDIDAINDKENIIIKRFMLGMMPKFIPENHYKDLRTAAWKNLEIDKKILNLVPKISPNSITLHIRKHHKYINIPIETYDKIIKEELDKDKSVKFFIASDNIEDKQYLITKYPENCFSNTINSYWISKGDEGVEDAFIDLLTINKTKKIYTPRESSFSFIAHKCLNIETVFIKGI